MGKLSASLGCTDNDTLAELISAYAMAPEESWPDPSVPDGGQASGVGESMRQRDQVSRKSWLR